MVLKVIDEEINEPGLDESSQERYMKSWIIILVTIRATSWALLACCAMYFLLGMCRMQALRVKLRDDYNLRIKPNKFENYQILRIEKQIFGH